MTLMPMLLQRSLNCQEIYGVNIIRKSAHCWMEVGLEKFREATLDD
jgi:hypothetical protein